jgi:hypothetical protein
VPPVAAGALFGAGLYAVAIAGVAPRIGLTQGEDREETSVALQRLGLHVLFGVITALVVDALAPIRRAPKPQPKPKAAPGVAAPSLEPPSPKTVDATKA